MAFFANLLRVNRPPRVVAQAVASSGVSITTVVRRGRAAPSPTYRYTLPPGNLLKRTISRLHASDRRRIFSWAGHLTNCT